MSQSPEFPSFPETFARPAALIAGPVGLASPLWGLFAGAAMGGSAWWWMTRWARTENLEAMLGVAGETATAMLASPTEAVAVIEVAAEAVGEAEPAVEAAAIDAVIEPPVLDAPVGGEAAPIAPAAAAPEPKTRAKKAESAKLD
jgi:hypothetical protein